MAAYSFDHPTHEQLVGYVDDRLHAADAEWIASHVEACTICAEDVADLRQMQTDLAPASSPVTLGSRQWPRWVVAGAAAAGIMAMVWLSRATPEPTPETVIVQAPASPATPAASPAPEPPASTLTPLERDLVARALASGDAPLAPFDRAVRLPAGTLLNEARPRTAFEPRSPVGTAVTSPRPRFAWTEAPGATSYTVSVFDDRFTEVASSGPLTITSWSPARDLPRDRVLSWQVIAETPSGRLNAPAPPLPEARFLVLSDERAFAIADARQRLSDEPLALGLVLSEAGLYPDARAVLTRAVGDARYDTAQVRAILTSLDRR